jgi:hypothetical protein
MMGDRKPEQRNVLICVICLNSFVVLSWIQLRKPDSISGTTNKVRLDTWRVKMQGKAENVI